MGCCLEEQFQLLSSEVFPWHLVMMMPVHVSSTGQSCGKTLRCSPPGLILAVTVRVDKCCWILAGSCVPLLEMARGGRGYRSHAFACSIKAWFQQLLMRFPLHLESFILASKLCLPDDLSHPEAARNSCQVISWVWVPKTVIQPWEDEKKKKSQTPVLTFGGSGWAQGLGVVGKGGQESGWHKVMENSGSKARDSEDWGPGKSGTNRRWVFNQEQSFYFSQPWQ